MNFFCRAEVRRNIRPGFNGLMNDGQNPFPFLPFYFQSRGAHLFRSDTRLCGGQFNILNQFWMNIQFQNRKKSTVDLKRLIVTT
jgi:hypothetical protein